MTPMIAFSASTATFRGFSGPERPFAGAAGGFRPSTHQSAPGQVQIGQSDQREHLCGVLREPLVAHLRVTELALDDAEHVLDVCANRGHLVVEALVRLGQRTLLAGLERYASEHTGLASLALERLIHAPLVAEHRPVVVTQRAWQLAHVRSVGGRDRHRVDKAGIDVHARLWCAIAKCLYNKHIASEASA